MILLNEAPTLLRSIPGVEVLLKKAYLDGLRDGTQVTLAACGFLIALFMLWRSNRQ